MIPRLIEISTYYNLRIEGGLVRHEEKQFKVRPMVIRRQRRSLNKKPDNLGYHYSVEFIGTAGMIDIHGDSAEGEVIRSHFLVKETPGFKPPKFGWVNDSYECYMGQRIPYAHEIMPEVKGKADFYSWQLYRWAKKHNGNNDTNYRMRVFRVSEGHCDQLYIGDMDKDERGVWLHGAKLRGICSYGNSMQSYAMRLMPGQAKEITDDFWAKYYQIGVCAIHGDVAHEWVKLTDEHRKCKYCHVEENKTIIQVDKEVWA